MSRFPLARARTFQLAILCAGSAAAQTTWFVDDDGVVGPGTYAEPFATIQEGIAAASDGDQVLVLPGIYDENVDFLGKAIHVRSAEGPLSTTIQGAPSPSFVGTVSFHSGEGPDSVIEGFTLQGPDLGWIVLCTDASATIRGNIIAGNLANVPGAGIFCVNANDLRILQNDISDNRSIPPDGGTGGGIWAVDSTLTIAGNRLLNNRADAETSGLGGGIYLSDCTAAINDNLIANNRAIGFSGNTGGGLYLFNCNATLANNTIADNIAVGGQGQQSRGGGIGLQGGLSKVSIVSTILWDNVSDFGTAVHVSGGTTALRFSDVEFGKLGTFVASGSLVWGDGNRNVLPLFVDEANDDYRLLPASPLIDLGLSPEPAGGTDPDLDPRQLDGNGDGVARIDIGADEHNRTLLSVTGNASLGGTLTFTTEGPAPNYTYVLLTAEDTGDHAFGAYGSLLLDLASLTVISIAVAPNSDDVLLPRDLSLAGQDLHAQSLAVDVTNVPGSFSNRLSFVLH